MISLFLRNLLFTILLPGSVVVLVPYLILGGEFGFDSSSIRLHQIVGAALFVLGLGVTLYCIFYSFAVIGRGTLAPIDPTEKLVVSGLYRYSRNPMYVGVITMLIAEALFTKVAGLLIYALIMFVLFNLFILLVEQPTLKRDFGEEYTEYCQKVRMWI